MVWIELKPTNTPAPDELESDTEDESPPTEPQTESESAEGSAAYDPVTGKINWDCPCLGGMAHGPCGPEFKEAFACFVYSEDEPKGINCVEKFKAMQDCFRLHPDIYGDGGSLYHDASSIARCSCLNRYYGRRECR
jgi:intermembrane space import and assembly protein 40